MQKYINDKKVLLFLWDAVKESRLKILSDMNTQHTFPKT